MLNKYGYPDFVKSTHYGEIDGLCGANCRHSYSPFIPGVSVPAYSDEELKSLNEQENTPKDYYGKQYTTYEATQRQRQLETAMRANRQKIKLLQEGGADEDDIILARCKYRGISQEYARFSKAMGLPQQRERIYGDGLGDIGRGKWKLDLSNKDFSDIIYMKGKMSNVDVRKWYIYHNKSIPDLIDKSKTLEEQARQACKLRNDYKYQARELMKDQLKRMELDKEHPILDFDYYYSKYSKEYESKDDVFKAIISSSTRPNKKVNKTLGLDE